MNKANEIAAIGALNKICSILIPRLMCFTNLNLMPESHGGFDQRDAALNIMATDAPHLIERFAAFPIGLRWPGLIGQEWA
jgi:hypothetical protein